MTFRIALGAAVVAAAALGGCASSGSAPAAGPTSLPSSPSSAASSSLTAIHPLRPLTCAKLPRTLGRFTPGGKVPSGVTVPKAAPTFTCKGAGGRVAVVWSSVAEAQYRQELLHRGWTAPGLPALFTKPGATHTIVLADVQADLVAVYKPR